MAWKFLSRLVFALPLFAFLAITSSSIYAEDEEFRISQDCIVRLPGVTGDACHTRPGGVRVPHITIICNGQTYKIDVDTGKPSSADGPELPDSVRKKILKEYEKPKPFQRRVKNFCKRHNISGFLKGCGALGGAICLTQNCANFANACESGDLLGAADAVCSQGGAPSPVDYLDMYDSCKRSDFDPEAAIGSCYGMIGQSFEGIGWIFAEGAECAFGWTSPEGSCAMPGVWSPWRPTEGDEPEHSIPLPLRPEPPLPPVPPVCPPPPLPPAGGGGGRWGDVAY